MQQCKICDAPLSLFEKGIFDDRHGFRGKFDIYRCHSCGFGQTVPEIPEDKISEIYTEYYPRKNLVDIDTLKNQPVELASHIKRLRLVRWWAGINNTAHFHVKKGTKVLDIGCGDCTSIREINAMGAEGFGIEPDHNIRPIVEALNLNVHIGLYNEINFDDNFFDFVTMSQVLEHVHKPVALLTALRRILNDKGQIIIGVPNIDSRLRKKFRGRWLNWHVPYHINHFSKRSILELANKSGYRVTKIKTYTPNLWVELQKRLFSYPVSEGVKVPFFNNETERPAPGNNNKRSSSTYLIGYINNKIRTKFLFRQFKIFHVLSLRLFDTLGKGESYLFILEKK